MTLIDITPTREQYARTIAYVMGSHLPNGVESFGDYWNYTTHEEDIIFTAWQQFESVAKPLSELGFTAVEFFSAKQMQKLVLECLSRAVAEPVEWNYQRP